MTDEIWRDIPEYLGKYQISNLGRVRSLFFRNNNCEYKPRLLIMKPFNNGNDYLCVSFSNGVKRKNHYIHRLVAEAFIDNPNGYDEVNHLDHNRSNNIVTNLEWCNRIQNVAYSAYRMKHPKCNSRATTSGEKYIVMRGKKYRVSIHNGSKTIADRQFYSLAEALSFRKDVVGW